MQLSGNQFRLTPETNSVGFVFKNLFVNNATGLAEIGFSGSGNVLKFLLRDNFIYSPQGKKVATYNAGEPIGLSGNIGTGVYSYYVNGDLINVSGVKTNFPIQRFFVNTTGCTMNVEPQLFSNYYDTGVYISGAFKALSGVSGTIVNNSSSRIRVFGSSIFFYGSYDALLTGYISGDVPAGGTLNFALNDLDSGRFDTNLNFMLKLDTSIGPIGKIFSINRVSGLSDTVRTLSSASGDFTFGIEWFGSGISNRFIYEPVSDSAFLSFSAFAETLSGVSKPKTLTVKVEAISPGNSGIVRTEYVTGLLITNTGQYATCPQAVFTGYYFVTGVSYANHLFSSGCTGSIPLIFTRNGGIGTGASGTLSVRRIRLSGVYGAGVKDFYVPDGVSITTGGTGYTLAPTVTLNTGVWAGCFDLAQNSGSVSIYTPFASASLALMTPSAAYLTGETLCTTGLVSGGTATGYIVTGVLITNDGSGYNTGNYVPRMSFIRGVGDTLTQNASGTLSMKSTGRYIFDQNWSVKTGIAGYNLALFSGTGLLPYTGQISLSAFQNYVTVQISHSGLDNTEPVVLKVTLTNEDGTAVSTLVSGAKTYDITTGHLKKKNLDSFIYLVPQSELSFLLTQDELDDLYSDPAYASAGGIDTGDLDF